MNEKKIILGLIFLLLLVIIVLNSCGKDNMYSQKTSLNFSELIKNENIGDVSLTIYYVNPYILTLYPWGVDDLIKNKDKKIIIKGSDLEEHFDLFNQLNNNILIPVKNETPYLNVRLYYVLESKKNGKLFDVAMSSCSSDSIFFNGQVVKGNSIFLDVIIPFLPKDAVIEFGKCGDLVGDQE